MNETATGPAYRIHTRRLVIRCWEPLDAPLLQAAIDENLDHLRPWMPWAMNEPTSVQHKIERLRLFRAQFDTGRDFMYAILDREESQVLGGTGLHTRLGPNALEIGYWMDKDHLNQGLATEVTAALTRVAFEINDVDRVEIHNDPINVRSAAVPRKLGFSHEATLLRRDFTSEGKPRDTMIWTLFAADYPGTPSSVAQIEAFDVVGRQILGYDST